MTTTTERTAMTTTELTHVQAFRPNSHFDEWFYVADTHAEALARADAGDTVTGEQCGNCGADGYQLHRIDALVFAKCIGADYADAHVDGCGTNYLVAPRIETLVVFP